MELKRACNRREVLFAGAAVGVAWVFGGCTDDDEDCLILHSLRYADVLLGKGFQHMYEHLSPEDRAVIDNEILKRTDVLIHIIRGKLFKEDSRGGSSTPHSNAEKDGRCSQSQHPGVKGIRKRRNWDLIYDAQRAEEETKQSGISNPIDAILYHEIFGHILPILRNPRSWMGSMRTSSARMISKKRPVPSKISIAGTGITRSFPKLSRSLQAMNSLTHSARHGRHHLSRWWAWIPFAPLLAGACDGCKAPGPRELVCKPIAYYEVLNPEQGAGKAPFSIERLGPEVNSAQLRRKPDVLWFPRKDRVTIGWDLGIDLYPMTDFIYSPGEGLARNVSYPDKVYPIQLFSDTKPERVRFGFRSRVCRKPSEDGSYHNCTPTENELFLVADMTCTWELYDPDEEIE